MMAMHDAEHGDTTFRMDAVDCGGGVGTPLVAEKNAAVATSQS